MNRLGKAAAAMAKAIGETAQKGPDGLDYVFFVIADAGDSFESVVAASLPPVMFAPVVRAWLERYDAGEATEFKPDA